MANEKRLIDANVVRHKINSFAASVVYRGNAEMFNAKDTCNPHEYTRGYERGILDAQKIVCGEETVDAVEVVHGEWTVMEDDWMMDTIYQCSACKEEFVTIDGTPADNLWHYCPNCGAKMDGGNEDG